MWRTKDLWDISSNNELRPTSLAGRLQQEILELAWAPDCTAPAARSTLLSQVGKRCGDVLGHCLPRTPIRRHDDER